MPFDHLWRRWDDAREAGRSPQHFLSEISDDSLIELLAGAGNERAYEKDIIRTELRNRLHRRKRTLQQAAEHAELVAERVVDVAKHTRDEAIESALLARGAADLQEGVELVADQAEDAAVAAQLAEVTAEEAERVSGRVHAATRALQAREE